jgi:hypothetical protein
LDIGGWKRDIILLPTAAMPRFFTIALFLSLFVSAAPPTNPTIRAAVASVSESNLSASLVSLESFGTRHTLSAADHPAEGIGAARRWLFERFKSFSPRLQVSYETHKVKAQGRIPRDVEVVNVVAILPGRTARQIVLGAHYDSLNLGGRAGQALDSAELTRQVELPAPGASDDASGTAAVLEAARILSQYEFEKTLVFVAFAGEEQMLVGSTLYAAAARGRGDAIEAMLNVDTIGDETAGNGRSQPNIVRVFSADPPESPSRSVARYFKAAGERYVPLMKVELVFRPDRFGRAGDHTPFDLEGFGAVRITTPNENYAHQHTAEDSVKNLSIPYTARVTRLTVAAAASLAMAPAPPVMDSGRWSRAVTRGESHYDAVIRWSPPEGSGDAVAGYSVVYRATTSPYWEKEVGVGKATEYTFKNLSVDSLVFGVKAIGTNGLESLVTSYSPPPPSAQSIAVY